MHIYTYTHIYFCHVIVSRVQEHFKEIVDFVTERNVSQRGMCNVKAIQTHLYGKYDMYFEPHIVYYALKSRLKFKYRPHAVASPDCVQ